jgi:simple sugar transport system ATP-binding protein
MLLDEGKIRAHAGECVSAYDIQTPSVEHVTKFLSGGNLQKVILARELWQSPRVLLAHQPTRGLDVGVIEYVHRQILGKREEGVGILLASEDLEELFNLSDRLLVMYKGQLMGIFKVEDISLERVGLLMAGVEEARG